MVAININDKTLAKLAWLSSESGLSIPDELQNAVGSEYSARHDNDTDEEHVTEIAPTGEALQHKLPAVPRLPDPELLDDLVEDLITFEGTAHQFGRRLCQELFHEQNIGHLFQAGYVAGRHASIHRHVSDVWAGYEEQFVQFLIAYFHAVEKVDTRRRSQFVMEVTIDTELNRILDIIQQQLRARGAIGDAITDVNGNRVGSWRIEQIIA